MNVPKTIPEFHKALNDVQKNGPSVTILMPIYNGIEFIDESVKSIMNQTWKKWELIIGINGHEAMSDIYLKAKEYENDQIHVVELYPIKGKSNALNEMLKLAKYDWIALLDVDDTWHKDKLFYQLPFCKVYDVIGTRAGYFGERSGCPPLPYNDLTNYNFLRGNPIINSSCLVRKDLCYWKPNQPLEDYEMWLRLWRLGKKFYNLPFILVNHRIHTDSAFNFNVGHDAMKSLVDSYR